MIAWFFGLSRMIQIVTYAGAVLGLIATGYQVAIIVEPVIPATHSYVRTEIANAFEKAQVEFLRDRVKKLEDAGGK